MLQHIDLVIQGHMQARHQVLGLDVLFHPVGAAVEAAFAPARQVQHGFAQGLGRDGAGVDGHSADAAALFHHQDGAPEFRRLDRRPTAGRAAAYNNEIVSCHNGMLHREIEIN